MWCRINLILAVLIALLTIGGIWASAQVTQSSETKTVDPLGLVAPTVIVGDDLGFRLESIQDNVPVGKIVVRIDGHWVDAQVGSSGIAATSSR